MVIHCFANFIYKPASELKYGALVCWPLKFLSKMPAKNKSSGNFNKLRYQ